MSDSLFRGAFSNPLVARQFLSAWLPEAFVALIDWDTLEVRKIAGINEALSERREDVVYRAEASGREVHFYLLVEHQLTTPRFMALRMLEYTLLIWRQWRSECKEEGAEAAPAALPFVVPVVLYPGPGPWGNVDRLRELIAIPHGLESWAAGFVPDGGFLLVELAGVPWEKLAGGHLARSILGAMQAERSGSLEFEKVRRIIAELFEEGHRRFALDLAGLLWTFLLQTSDLRREEVRRIVEETILPEERERFMTTAERLKEEGRVEGRVEGQEEALRESVLAVLEARFGPLTCEVQDAVHRISDLSRIRQLVRVAGTCSSLEEFLATV